MLLKHAMTFLPCTCLCTSQLVCLEFLVNYIVLCCLLDPPLSLWLIFLLNLDNNPLDYLLVLSPFLTNGNTKADRLSRLCKVIGLVKNRDHIPTWEVCGAPALLTPWCPLFYSWHASTHPSMSISNISEKPSSSPQMKWLILSSTFRTLCSFFCYFTILHNSDLFLYIDPYQMCLSPTRKISTFIVLPKVVQISWHRIVNTCLWRWANG